jgi:hypothetical protein
MFKAVALRDEYRAIAEAQDLEDPILFQHRLLTDETIPATARAVIANQIAPYYRPKLGIMEPAKFIQTPIEVPAFTTCEDAEAFLLLLAQREAAQELDSVSVAAVSARVLDWIHSKRAGQELEIKRINATQDTGDQVIKIEGGLPTLPGCENLIMPQLNGHPATELLAVDRDTPQTMTTKDNGFICTWVRNPKGGWLLQGKAPDPSFASSGPSLNTQTKPDNV